MSPLITVIGAAALLILLQLIVGTRSSAETRRVYAYLLRDARRRARRSFSVIVPLERRAETLYPLLDHLYVQEYNKLQIIVVVKQTAGSRAVSELQSYRRRAQRKELKIVKYQRGMTEAVIARRHARHDYILTLASTDRLSPRFFAVVSQILIATKTDALAVRSLVRPTRTFAQAFWSLTSLLRVTGAAATGGTLPESYTIVRRRALQAETETHELTFIPHQFYVTPSSQPRASAQLSWRSLSIALSAGCIATIAYFVVAYVLDVATAQLYGWIILSAVEVAAVVCMLQFKGYRFLDYLNILLFVPLAPLYALAQIVYRGIKALFNAARHLQLSSQQSPQR